MGFGTPEAVFRIPKPWIPDSTGKIFPNSGFHEQNFHEVRNADFMGWLLKSRLPKKVFSFYDQPLTVPADQHNTDPGHWQP